MIEIRAPGRLHLAAGARVLAVAARQRTQQRQVRQVPQVVLVTGCSSGFGELIAQTLARAGHHVFATMRGIADRNLEPTERFHLLAQAEQLDLQVVEMDVASDASVARGVDQIVARAGRIDVVVNNAGISSSGPLEAFSVDQMAALLNVNALGPMRVNKAVLGAMRARRSGQIIWISSTLGRVLRGRGGLYPASKWAAEGLAESLHHQIAPFGIDLTILEPDSYPTAHIYKSMVAEDQEIAAAYAALDARANGPAQGAPQPDYRPHAQEVADAVKQLIDIPAGRRPLRMVVGPDFTDMVVEYNQAYERLRAHLAEVLSSSDQATVWSRTRPRPAPWVPD
jgi:NAD(P)-dependent dehydrogenase (short-subunit alcohol dehydrogenase family)